MDICVEPGCRRKVECRGFCHTHYCRAVRKGELTILESQKGVRRPKPAGFRVTRTYSLNNNGYVLKRAGPNDWRLEHRIIMEGMLGRPLYDNERIHHKNGDRTDNRPDNLELWIRSQPDGQRVEDLLAWAREIIARYG